MTTLSQTKELLYRQEDDRNDRWLSRWQDWAVVAGFLTCLFLFINYFRQIRHKNVIHISLTLLLLLHLLSKYLLNRKHYQPASRLPLYSCNLSAIILVLDFFIPETMTWWQPILVWGAFAGIYGGFLAIVFSAPSTYLFPHITHFDYYIGHVCITFLGLFYVMEQTHPFTLHALLLTSVITVIYLLLVNRINPRVNGNFGFITEAPEQIAFLNVLPQKVYKLLCTVSYLLANYLTWKTANMLIWKE